MSITPSSRRNMRWAQPAGRAFSRMCTGYYQEFRHRGGGEVSEGQGRLSAKELCGL